MRTTIGYELLRWLAVLVESELAFTDTSESQDPSNARAFPIWGLGGGLRFGASLTSRLGGFIEGHVGAMAAAVPHNTLGNLGFGAAESPGAVIGGRLGVEWYQVDPHLALSIQAGTRAASSFSTRIASGDVPLMWDVTGGLRYTF
jgi:hypothetical protein